MHTRLSRLVLILAVLYACAAPVQAQHEVHETPMDRSAETKASVPELKEFHKVIYQIWHGAWPKKDTEQLAGLLPKVETSVRSVSKAQLPGILRERKAAWEENILTLKAAAWDYRSAVEDKDQQALLDAAENLHSQYERLVRVIRPALKELEEFHAVLYILYHYYMPGDSLDQMRSSAVALKEKMAELNKAVLPERLKSKEASFSSARQKLSVSVDALASTAGSSDLKSIKSAVNVLHTDYQAVEKVFE